MDLEDPFPFAAGLLYAFYGLIFFLCDIPLSFQAWTSQFAFLVLAGAALITIFISDTSSSQTLQILLLLSSIEWLNTLHRYKVGCDDQCHRLASLLAVMTQSLAMKDLWWPAFLVALAHPLCHFTTLIWKSTRTFQRHTDNTLLQILLCSTGIATPLACLIVARVESLRHVREGLCCLVISIDLILRLILIVMSPRQPRRSKRTNMRHEAGKAWESLYKLIREGSHPIERLFSPHTQPGNPVKDLSLSAEHCPKSPHSAAWIGTTEPSEAQHYSLHHSQSSPLPPRSLYGSTHVGKYCLFPLEYVKQSQKATTLQETSLCQKQGASSRGKFVKPKGVPFLEWCWLRSKDEWPQSWADPHDIAQAEVLKTRQPQLRMGDTSRHAIAFLEFVAEMGPKICVDWLKDVDKAAFETWWSAHSNKPRDEDQPSEVFYSLLEGCIRALTPTGDDLKDPEVCKVVNALAVLFEFQCRQSLNPVEEKNERMLETFKIYLRQIPLAQSGRQAGALQ